MDQPIALITGAGRGIGRATAIELARRGYRLLLTARTQSELQQTAELAGGGEILAGDVTSPQHAERLIARAVAMGGGLEVLVNNAGYAPALSMEEITIDEWQKILATNLSAAFYLCKFAWPILVKQKGGVIVNISSLASRDPFPGLGAYGAAKAGLNIFGLDLVRQGIPRGIRVYTLTLGAVETTMLRNLIPDRDFPMEKVLSPDAVAAKIYACIADERLDSTEIVYQQK